MTDGPIPLVRRGVRNARYTAISNTIIDHPTLSPEARIVLIYLLSKPDDWQLRIHDLRRLLGTGQKICGRNKAYEVLKALKASAYVVAVEELQRGRFHRLTYYVFDEPHVDPEGFRAALRRTPAEPRSGEEPAANSPRPEFGEAVAPPRPATPHPEKRHPTKEGNTQNTESPPPSPERMLRRRGEGRGDDLAFSKFWRAWPEADRPRERAYVQKLFLGLTANDRDQAAVHAGAYRAVQRQSGQFAAMILYLRDRRFVDFEGAPDVDHEGFFVITRAREEWRAWLDHYRERFSETVLASSVARGSLLTRTRWPVEPSTNVPVEQNWLRAAPALRRSGLAQQRLSSRS